MCETATQRDTTFWKDLPGRTEQGVEDVLATEMGMCIYETTATKTKRSTALSSQDCLHF